MLKQKKLISIVIPVYNEEEVIPELIKRLKKFINKQKNYSFEIVAVEHGSTDRSFELLSKNAKKDKRFKVLQLSRNFTCDGGIAAGLHFVSGDACVIMMADLQEPIEFISNFIKKWQQGYEIVYGIVKKRTASKLRNFNSTLFYKIINIFTNNIFPENASDFRLIDKKVYQAVNQMKEQNKYLRGLIMWTGFSHTGIAFDRKKRYAGTSKADFKTVLKVALDGILSFSYLPLKITIGLGLIMSLLSFLLLIYFLALYIMQGKTVPGHMSLITIVLFLFGMLFLIMGIIGEYLGRVYDEVKQRPSFIVKNKVGFKDGR